MLQFFLANKRKSIDVNHRKNKILLNLISSVHFQPIRGHGAGAGCESGEQAGGERRATASRGRERRTEEYKENRGGGCSSGATGEGPFSSRDQWLQDAVPFIITHFV